MATFHAPNHKIYKTKHNPNLPEDQQNKYTTGWGRKYVGKGGDSIVKVLENRWREGDPVKLSGRVNQPRYKSKKSHNAALAKNTWTMWVKRYSAVYKKKFAESMCNQDCKREYESWKIGNADLLDYIWPQPSFWDPLVHGAWSGEQAELLPREERIIPKAPEDDIQNHPDLWPHFNRDDIPDTGEDLLIIPPHVHPPARLPGMNLARQPARGRGGGGAAGGRGPGGPGDPGDPGDGGPGDPGDGGGSPGGSGSPGGGGGTPVSTVYSTTPTSSVHSTPSTNTIPPQSNRVLFPPTGPFTTSLQTGTATDPTATENIPGVSKVLSRIVYQNPPTTVKVPVVPLPPPTANVDQNIQTYLGAPPEVILPVKRSRAELRAEEQARLKRIVAQKLAEEEAEKQAEAKARLERIYAEQKERQRLTELEAIAAEEARLKRIEEGRRMRAAEDEAEAAKKKASTVSPEVSPIFQKVVVYMQQIPVRARPSSMKKFLTLIQHTNDMEKIKNLTIYGQDPLAEYLNDLCPAGTYHMAAMPIKMGNIFSTQLVDNFVYNLTSLLTHCDDTHFSDDNFPLWIRNVEENPLKALKKILVLCYPYKTMKVPHTTKLMIMLRGEPSEQMITSCQMDHIALTLPLTQGLINRFGQLFVAKWMERAGKLFFDDNRAGRNLEDNNEDIEITINIKSPKFPSPESFEEKIWNTTSLKDEIITESSKRGLYITEISLKTTDWKTGSVTFLVKRLSFQENANRNSNTSQI